MFLTKYQERMLNGEMGEAISKSFELIVKIGDLNNADKLIPIKNAQIAGVSYYTVGESIFSFLELFSKDKIKVKVPSWLNPAGMDSVKWKEMGISEDFAEKQNRIIKYYMDMGIELTLTCTPYLIGYAPAFGENLSWSESSAVSVANGYYGARTNREGAPLALASAVIGLTANYGLHMNENRMPKILIDVQTEIKHFSDYSALGYWYGQTYKGVIPYFKGLKKSSVDQVKMLAAAMAASGSVAHFHIENQTPESKIVDLGYIDENVEFSLEDKKSIYSIFHQAKEQVDLVAIGCPHTSVDDLRTISSIVGDKSLRKGTDFWIFSSKKELENPESKLLISQLEGKGIRIFTDTCMVVSPVIREKYENIITNSTKAAFYLTRKGSNKVNLQSLEEISLEVFE
ncbi:MAG: aconitase X catalytic domain-containing protein [Candidatus Heimdallarchaeaceae archaeon]